jgi:hypothetical protein
MRIYYRRRASLAARARSGRGRQKASACRTSQAHQVVAASIQPSWISSETAVACSIGAPGFPYDTHGPRLRGSTVSAWSLAWISTEQN